MAIRTKHFSEVNDDSVKRKVFIPGFTGPIQKKLVGTPVRVRQTGLTDVDNSTLTDLRSGKGDPATTSTLDAQYLGSFTNMHKAQVSIEAIPGADCARYEIIWEQVTTS